MQRNIVLMWAHDKMILHEGRLNGKYLHETSAHTSLSVTQIVTYAYLARAKKFPHCTSSMLYYYITV